MKDKIRYIFSLNFLIFSLLLALTIYRVLVAINTSDTRSIVNNEYGKVSLIGYVYSETEYKSNNQTFLLKYEDIKIKIYTEPYKEYRYGDKVSVVGKINRPRNFSSQGRVFDYVNYLRKDDIYYEIKNARVEIIEELKPSLGLTYISRLLFDIKSGFVYNLNRVLGEPHSALGAGLVIGEKSLLGRDLLSDFRKSGLIHIVVLSGYNITIVAVTIRRLLSFLPRNISITFGILGIFLFGMLVGGGATVVRSCFMAVLSLLGDLSRKPYNVMRALIIAGFIMVLHKPLILLYDPSFQLSFLATFGLIILSPSIEKRLGFITERFGMRGIVSSTIATQIFVSPYLLYMVGQISLIGIFVNILVLPLIPFTMLTISLSGISGFISFFVSKIFAYVSHILLSYELFIVRISAKLPISYIDIGSFDFYWVAIVYALYFLLLFKFSSIFDQFKFWKKSST